MLNSRPANHLTTGKRGEILACAHLERKGYRVLEQNWRHGRYEIDIIAAFEDLLVIVEVKARSSTSWGAPESFVTIAKWRNLVFAAGRYMEKYDLDREVRFDIVAVTLDPVHAPGISHYKDVYCPMNEWV